MNPELAIASWTNLYSAQIRPPETESQYLELLEFINHLTDNFNTDLEPYHGLWVLVAGYLQGWEEANQAPIAESEPHQLLRFLMEQHNLKAKDFAEIDQSLLSKILRGQRKISKKLARVFAARFATPISVFL